MSTNEDRQMLGHLRQLSATMQTIQGARKFVTLLDRGSGNRDTGLIVTPIAYERLVVSIYSLKPFETPAETEKTSEKAPATKSSPKPTLTVRVNGFLTETEIYPIVSDALIKEGQHMIALPFLSAKCQIVIECDGQAEYAVFGL